MALRTCLFTSVISWRPGLIARFQIPWHRPSRTGISEPIGGDTYWFGYAEYTIPIIERLRFALFYDIGDVQLKPYHFDFKNFSDNWGIGLRLTCRLGRCASTMASNKSR